MLPVASAALESVVVVVDSARMVVLDTAKLSWVLALSLGFEEVVLVVGGHWWWVGQW